MDTFRIEGSYNTTPLTGWPSGVPALEAPIAVTMQLVSKALQQYILDDDAIVSVGLAAIGVDEVNAMMISVIGGPITVTITWVDGTDQTFPVDGFLALTTLTNAITALSLTRAPSTYTTVNLFLGKHSA
jgi:hypothetical protein